MLAKSQKLCSHAVMKHHSSQLTKCSRRKAGQLGQRTGNTAIALGSDLYIVNMKCNFYICRHTACGSPFGLQSQQTSGWASCENRSKLQPGVPHTRLFLSALPVGSFASLDE